LVRFLQEDLQLSAADLALALKHPDSGNNLPTILWQYGAITTQQLDRVFDWLERWMSPEGI
jgi:hypothetical protein